jgi:hypothetical protein
MKIPSFKIFYLKRFIINITFCLLLYSCLIQKRVAHSNNQLNNSNIELSVKYDSINGIVEIYTDAYKRDEKIIYGKENRSEISYEIEYNISLSRQSKEMIEKDGGMDNIVKKLLSKENYAKLGNRYSVPVKVTMYLDGRQVTGYSFSIRTRNKNKLKLTQKEIDKMYNYFHNVAFIYTGNKFKDEIVPVGYTFVVRK